MEIAGFLFCVKAMCFRKYLIHNYSRSSFMVFENRSCLLALCLDNRNGAFLLAGMVAKYIYRCFAG